MNGTVISAFAGVGKTTLSQKYPELVCDLESSDFQWIYDDIKEIKLISKEERKGIIYKKLNPKWPMNYMEAINENSKKYKIVLISQQNELRDFLEEQGVAYILCFPKKECKEEYVARYQLRGNHPNFIQLMKDNFDNWIDLLYQEKEEKIILSKGEYLMDKIQELDMLN